MKRLLRGSVLYTTLVAGVLIGIVSLLGITVMPEVLDEEAEMFLSPQSLTLIEGTTFTVELMVRSRTPSNVFAGELHFNPEVIQVESISYNTSIADLWAERPWYENGDGTLNFIGGTTERNGFLGTDSLLTITFRSVAAGEGTLSIASAHILKHDGFGTEIELPKPIDGIFTVSEEERFTDIAKVESDPVMLKVVSTMPSTDLNGDGKQTFADVGIFMLKIGSDDLRYDFNLDGSVGIADLNILLSR